MYMQINIFIGIILLHAQRIHNNNTIIRKR